MDGPPIKHKSRLIVEEAPLAGSVYPLVMDSFTTAVLQDDCSSLVLFLPSTEQAWYLE